MGISPVVIFFPLCVVQNTVRKAYSYRCHSTEEQARERTRPLGCVRSVWSGAPALRTEAWFERERVDHAETGRPLMRMKPEQAWLAERQALRRLNTAMGNLFAARAKYPHFHRRHDGHSAAVASGGGRGRSAPLLRLLLARGGGCPVACGQRHDRPWMAGDRHMEHAAGRRTVLAPRWSAACQSAQAPGTEGASARATAPRRGARWLASRPAAPTGDGLRAQTWHAPHPR